MLMVMHVPAAMELGAARGQLELAEVLRGRGCEVRVIDREEILGGRESGRLGASPDAFAAAAVRLVRAIARDYDVIDAHQGNLPVPKARLGFAGLMVARSVGLAPLYAEFLRRARKRWPEKTRGHIVMRPARRWRGWRSLQNATKTFRLCDLIVVPNSDEQDYLATHLDIGEKTVVLPLGISDSRLQALASRSGGRAQTGPRVAFIGDWSARKGCHDWPEIAAKVRRRVSDATFLFLGTHVSADEVVRAMGVTGDAVDVVPSYRSEQLPDLLDGVRAGALPSYIEGLGLGALEKMASGIPSVCYDVPGPRETLGRVDSSLLVAAGDTDAFAERLADLLVLDAELYTRLSERCRAVAEQFSWGSIGADTLSIYRERLAIVRGYTDAHGTDG